MPRKRPFGVDLHLFSGVIPPSFAEEQDEYGYELKDWEKDCPRGGDYPNPQELRKAIKEWKNAKPSPPNLKDIDWEAEINVVGLEAEQYGHCCGVGELCLEILDEFISGLAIQKQQKVNDAVKGTLQILMRSGRLAAIVFTDTIYKSPVHSALSALSPPIKLGPNPKSNNNLQMWVISRDQLR